MIELEVFLSSIIRCCGYRSYESRSQTFFWSGWLVVLGPYILLGDRRVGVFGGQYSTLGKY